MVANVAAGLVHVREYLRFRYDRWETVRSHYRKWPRSCGDTSDITRSARLRARATAVNHKCETSVARCGYGENRPARQGSREIALMALSVIGAPVLGEVFSPSISRQDACFCYSLRPLPCHKLPRERFSPSTLSGRLPRSAGGSKRRNVSPEVPRRRGGQLYWPILFAPVASHRHALRLAVRRRKPRRGPGYRAS